MENSPTQPPFDPPEKMIKKGRKSWKIVVWTLVLALLGLVGWIGITGFVAVKNITAKNTSDEPSFFQQNGTVSPDSLKEGDSRINILNIGVDNAAGLTDSIQIASVDPINNKMAMLSIPRDLYVKNPDGVKTKINEVYNRNAKTCVKKTSICDPEIDYGAVALKTVLSDILGIKIHYFAKVDFAGLTKIVDGVGGLDVVVKDYLRDPEYPCDNNPNKPCGYTQPAGTFHMTGAQVLKYARCRKGNCGDDFGRALRQQQIVTLLQKKLLTAGVLTNPKKITDLITIAGTHLRTDAPLSDISQLFKITEKIDSAKITNAVLDDSETGLLKSVNLGAYMLIPKAGENDFSQIKIFVLSIFPEPYVIKEAATLELINASGKEANGKALADQLKKAGYTVITTTTATTLSTTSSLTGSPDKPYTLALLKKRFSLTSGQVKKKTKSAAGQADIVLTIGTNYPKL